MKGQWWHSTLLSYFFWDTKRQFPLYFLRKQATQPKGSRESVAITVFFFLPQYGSSPKREGCSCTWNNQRLSWFVSVIFHNGEQNNKLWVADATGALMERITSWELCCLSWRWIYSFIDHSTHRHWAFSKVVFSLSLRTFSLLTMRFEFHPGSAQDEFSWGCFMVSRKLLAHHVSRWMLIPPEATACVPLQETPHLLCD